MVTTKRYPFLVLLASALLGLLAVAAVAENDDSNPPGQDVAQVASIEADAQKALSVLRRHRGSADALPARVAGPMDARAEFGLNTALSRLAIGNATNSVYVLPARDHVCVSITVGQGANLSCPTTRDVADGKAPPATVGLETRDIGIYGIVPDGVDSVSVQTGASDSTVVSTQDNAYYLVVPEGTQLRSVRYTGPSGPVEFPIYDAAAVFEE